MPSHCRCLSFMIACLVGCTSADETVEPRSFAGPVSGSDAFIGVVVDDEATFAYVCNGTPAGLTITSWIVGTADADSFEGENPAGSALVGEIHENRAEGTFTTAMGAALRFTADEIAAPSGLYFGERGHGPEEIWGGWIMIGAEQRGAVVDRTSGDIVGSPSIDPAAPSVDVDDAPLEYEHIDAPIGETLDDVPPG